MKRKLALLLLLALLPLAAAQTQERGAGVEAEIVILSDIGLIIVAATIFAFFAVGLKQPLIPAYIIAGVIIGPIGAQAIFGTTLVQNPVFVRALSELGITFLLFTVGIELDLSRLKDVGRAAALIGTGQVALTFAAGFFIAVGLGFGQVEALYLGLVVAFSSTLVVIKMLSDRDEIETLHGRVILGILLMQDIIVVLALSVLGATNGMGSLSPVIDAILKAVGLFSFAIVLSRYVAPRILKAVSRSVELVFLTALSFAFIFAISSYILGFSTAIGGFLGGLSLAVFPYNLEVANRIKPLRDFFAIMFFVSLGMQFSPLSELSVLIVPVILFAAIVMVLKPLIITLLSIMVGYERRTAFLSGAGLAQISEFSLILAIGLAAMSPETSVLPVTLLLALVTMSVTPYLIRYGNRLYIPFSGLLQKLEKLRFVKLRHELEHIPAKHLKNHIVVFGAHIMGMEVIETLQKLKKKFIVVDHNPEIIKRLIKGGVHCVYGDLEDAEVLKRVGLDTAKAVISTVPDEDDSMLLIKKVKSVNPNAMLFVTAKTIGHAIRFYREGADFIIHLKLLGGREASEHLENTLKKGSKAVLKRKLNEIKRLEKKKREELVNRIDDQLMKEIDELKAQEALKTSEALGEE